MKFKLGSRGSPGGGLGAKPPEAERFSFSEGDCRIKTGGPPPSVEDFRGVRPPHLRGDRGCGRKEGSAAPAPVSATDVFEYILL